MQKTILAGILTATIITGFGYGLVNAQSISTSTSTTKKIQVHKPAKKPVIKKPVRKNTTKPVIVKKVKKTQPK